MYPITQKSSTHVPRRWLMDIVVYLYIDKKQTINQFIMKNTVCENNSVIHYRTIVRNNKTLIIWKNYGTIAGWWSIEQDGRLQLPVCSYTVTYNAYKYTRVALQFEGGVFT